MCRNIKTLFNLDPTATEEEVRAAALQFVRKVSGFHTPSQRNEAAFRAAVEAVAAASLVLLNSLETKRPPSDRALAAEKAQKRAAQRFAQ
jgi:hypothetical protein